MLIVGASTVPTLDTAPNWEALCEEYYLEGGVPGMPHPTRKMSNYRKMEEVGLLHPYSAVLDDELIGFAFVLVSVLPHYGYIAAIMESIFVAAAKRKSGAGLKLLGLGYQKAADVGAPGLLVSTPYGGVLSKVLPSLGYTEVSKVFFKQVPNG